MFPFLRRLTQTGVRLPGSGLNTYLSTLTGPDWASRFGDTTAGRVRMVGLCLVVTIGDTIVFPGGTTTVSILGDATGAFVAGTLTWTAAGSGYIYAITTNLDLYECGEGSESTIYSSARVNKPAALSGITWDYQSKYPHPANARGYRLSGSVIVPMLLDGSGYADDGTLTGGYVGKVAWPGRFRQAACATMPEGLNQSIVSGSFPAALNATSTFTIAFWGLNPVYGNTLRVGYRVTTLTNAYVSLATNSGVDTIMFLVSNGHLAAVRASLPSPRSWHFFVAVFDGNQTGDLNRARIYVDGTLCDSTVAYAGFPSTTADVAATQKLKIGFVGDAVSSTNGQISGLKVFAEALSASQVLALYQNGQCSTAPTLAWPLCEGAGLNGWDVAGTNHWTSTIPADTLWANRQDATCYPLTNGYQDCLIGSDHVCVPRKLDSSWINPTATATINHPTIANGFNGCADIDICMLDLLPSYNGHIPAEMTAVYDLVEDRGTGGFPYGDYRDVTVTFAELLALKTDTVDASIRRRLCARTIKDSSGNVIGLDRIVNYTQQLAKNLWAILLRWNRSITR